MGASGGYLAYCVLAVVAYIMQFTPTYPDAGLLGLIALWFVPFQITYEWIVKARWDSFDHQVVLFSASCFALIGLGAGFALWRQRTQPIPEKQKPRSPAANALYVVIALLLILVSLQSWTSYREYQALKSSLGGKNAPLWIIDQTVRNGMTREQVEEIARGYVWVETSPPIDPTGGPTDTYHFKFGILKNLKAWPDHGRIRVYYDKKNRVDLAVADFE